MAAHGGATASNVTRLYETMTRVCAGLWLAHAVQGLTSGGVAFLAVAIARASWGTSSPLDIPKNQPIPFSGSLTRQSQKGGKNPTATNEFSAPELAEAQVLAACERRSTRRILPPWVPNLATGFAALRFASQSGCDFYDLLQPERAIRARHSKDGSLGCWIEERLPASQSSA